MNLGLWLLEMLSIGGSSAFTGWYLGKGRGYEEGWQVGRKVGYHDRLDEVDLQRARELFAPRDRYVEGVGVVFGTVNHLGIELLKENPAEYFRLNRIWHDRQRADDL